MSYEMLTHCYDWLRQVIDCKGNHIITLAVQAHNGELCEPHNSKLKTNRKREDISATNRFVLSFCRYRGWGSAHIAFVRTNAMLAPCSKYKFSAKDITAFDLFLLFFVLLLFLVFCPALAVYLVCLIYGHKGLLVCLVDYIHKLRVFVHRKRHH